MRNQADLTINSAPPFSTQQFPYLHALCTSLQHEPVRHIGIRIEARHVAGIAAGQALLLDYRNVPQLGKETGRVERPYLFHLGTPPRAALKPLLAIEHLEHIAIIMTLSACTLPIKGAFEHMAQRALAQLS